MINIPYRKNGQRITASWFNRIRQYLSNLFLSGKRLKVNPTDNKPIDYYVSVGNEFLNHEPDSLIIVEDGVPGVHNTIHLPPIEDIDLQFTIKNLSDELLDIVTTETDIVNGDTIELLNDVKNKLVLRKNESVTVHADAYRPEWNVIGNVTDNFFKTEKDTDGVRNVSIDGTDNAYLKLNEPLDIQNCRLRFSDESQKLEYSTDKGVTWNKVEGSGGGGGSASTPFAINSGYAENGHNAIMSGVGTNTINFNTTVPIKVTTASGKNGELVKVDPVTVSNDGTFNVFVDAVTGDVRLYNNKVYIQSETPTAENNFDVWLDTTVEPMTLKIWSGSAWVERDNFIWFGSVTVTGGNVAVLNNKGFNINYTIRKNQAIDYTTVYDLWGAISSVPARGEEYYTFEHDGEFVAIATSDCSFHFMFAPKYHDWTKFPPTINIHGDAQAWRNDRVRVSKGDKLYIYNCTRGRGTGSGLWLYPYKE